MVDFPNGDAEGHFQPPYRFLNSVPPPSGVWEKSKVHTPLFKGLNGPV